MGFFFCCEGLSSQEKSRACLRAEKNTAWRSCLLFRSWSLRNYFKSDASKGSARLLVMVFLTNDISVYRMSRPNWTRTMECFTWCVLSWCVLSPCVLDLTTSLVLISMSNLTVYFDTQYSDWKQQALKNAEQSVKEGSMGAVMTGNEMLWKTNHDLAEPVERGPRREVKGGRCLINCLHSTGEALRCFLGSWWG